MRPPLWSLRLVVLVLAAVALLGRARAHVDDSDHQLYTVVARNLVADGAWFDLRYLPTVHPHFREHLPFGLWPSAVVVRLVGEAGLPYLSALWALLTLALVMELGRRLDGPLLGVLAGFFLFTTEQFLFFGALHRLDAPLTFFALLAAAPLLVGGRGVGAGALAVGAGVAACALKGPFGLVPLVAAACARAAVERDWRWLTRGALASVLAAAPVAGFLLVDRAQGGDWWSGYLEAQLLASAQGTRADGEGTWTPVVAVFSRYWPWLPLLFLGAWRARTWAVARVLVVTAGLGLLFLLLPSRKLAHHVLVLFPLFSLLAAAGVVAPVQRWVTRSPRWVLGGAAVVALLTVLIATVDLMPRGRAVSCTAFRDVFAAQPAGAEVLVSPRAWREISVLAGELRLTPVMVDRLPADGAAQLALISEDSGLVVAAPWQEVRAARGWRLLRR